MMTLEQRARHAAEAVHTSTAEYVPRAGLADVARRRTQRRAAGVALAGTAVFVALIAGSYSRSAAGFPSRPSIPGRAVIRMIRKPGRPQEPQ